MLYYLYSSTTNITFDAIKNFISVSSRSLFMYLSFVLVKPHIVNVFVPSVVNYLSFDSYRQYSFVSIPGLIDVKFYLWSVRGFEKLSKKGKQNVIEFFRKELKK